MSTTTTPSARDADARSLGEALRRTAAHPPQAPGRGTRLAATTAIAWALAFAVANAWVQVDAMADPAHLLHDHQLGAALLNGVAIALKLVGAGAAALALGRPDPRLAGPLVAALVAAVTTLGAYGLVGLGAVAAEGSLLDGVALAGGTWTIVAWTYPAFFLVGAVAFAGPMVHAARSVARPGRWIALGAVGGPVAVLGAVSLAAVLLVRAGLLPG